MYSIENRNPNHEEIKEYQHELNSKIGSCEFTSLAQYFNDHHHYYTFFESAKRNCFKAFLRLSLHLESANAKRRIITLSKQSSLGLLRKGLIKKSS
jgi:hypothetical protein